MKNRTGPFAAPTLEPALFAKRLVANVEQAWHVMEALVELRGRGDQPSRTAIGAILDLPDIKRMKASWELWDCIVIGDGYEPDDLLLDHLTFRVLELGRRALWGEPW